LLVHNRPVVGYFEKKRPGPLRYVEFLVSILVGVIVICEIGGGLSLGRLRRATPERQLSAEAGMMSGSLAEDILIAGFAPDKQTKNSLYYQLDRLVIPLNKQRFAENLGSRPEGYLRATITFVFEKMVIQRNVRKLTVLWRLVIKYLTIRTDSGICENVAAVAPFYSQRPYHLLITRNRTVDCHQLFPFPRYILVDHKSSLGREHDFPSSFGTLGGDLKAAFQDDKLEYADYDQAERENCKEQIGRHGIPPMIFVLIAYLVSAAISIHLMVLGGCRFMDGLRPSGAVIYCGGIVLLIVTLAAIVCGWGLGGS